MDCARVLLIQPPTSVRKGAVFNSSFPLGLAYMAAYVEREVPGVEVVVLDATAEGYRERRDDESGRFEVFGLGDAVIRRRIAAVRPLVVGISCLFTNQHSIALRMARLAKEVDPRIVTVMGGAHSSGAAADVLQCPHVDAVVNGPGEETLKDLVACLRAGAALDRVPGITCRRDGTVVVSPMALPTVPLDSYPFPALEKLPIALYRELGNYSAIRPAFPPALPIITSRGCAYRCVFCYVNGMWGSGMRYRSLENVLDEVKLWRERYDVQEIHIMDDNFGYRKEPTYALLDGLKALGVRKIVPINGSTLVALQDPVFLAKMRELGYEFLRVYMESADPDTLKKMHKPHRLVTIHNVIDLARKHGFLLYGSYMLGFPWQTIDDMTHEVELARSLDVDYWSFNSVMALPGTELYDQCRREGFLAPEVGFDDLTLYSGNIRTPAFSNLDVERITKQAFLTVNFSSAERVARAARIFNVPVENILERKRRAESFLSALPHGSLAS